MRLWSRRLLYLMTVVIWLILMSLPVLAFLLATQGEVRVGQEGGRGARIFLLQERDLQGIGIQWTRSKSGRDNCTITNLYYLLWEGASQGQNTSYCRCMDPATGQLLPVEPCDLP